MIKMVCINIFESLRVICLQPYQPVDMTLEAVHFVDNLASLQAEGTRIVVPYDGGKTLGECAANGAIVMHLHPYIEPKDLQYGCSVGETCLFAAMFRGRHGCYMRMCYGCANPDETRTLGARRWLILSWTR
jgi:hypothetical protein